MTLEYQIRRIMETPEGLRSYDNHGRGLGLTYYDYIKMIVLEYKRISVNVYA